jgi:nickel superoxide dismutase
MINKVTSTIKQLFPAEEVHAHCDGPCGVYDPASARIAAEAVLSMTKKLLALDVPAAGNKDAVVAYNNTFSRYVAIKEEQAHLAKTELLVLWTDYFKSQHLEQFPDLHDTFWKAAKLCSACKVGVSLADAEALMETCEKIHDMFWQSKGRDVAYYTAG